MCRRIVCLSLLLSAGVVWRPVAAQQPVIEDGPKNWIEIDGKRTFWFGTNYPWFGGYPFRSIDIGGLRTDKTMRLRSGETFGPGQTAFSADRIGAQMRDMHGFGVRVVRWFLCYDARGVFAFDSRGFCTGLTPHTLENFGRVVQLAEERGLKLYPSLLNFHFVCGTLPGNKQRKEGEKPIFTDGSTQEPMGSLFRDPRKRRALIERGIVPLVKSVATSRTILAWELMNEPGNVTVGRDPVTGFQVRGGGNHLPEHACVQLADMQAFFNEAYDAIKAVDSRHPINPAGESNPWRLKLWVGRVKADFYGAHYHDFGKDYGKVRSVRSLSRVMNLPIDKPLLMTESVADMEHKLPYYVEAAYRGGWAGILTWNYYTALHGRWGQDFRRFTSKQSSSRTPEYMRRWQETHAKDTEFAAARPNPTTRPRGQTSEAKDSIPNF